MNRSEAERLLPRYFRGDLSQFERDQLIRAVLHDQDLYNAFADEQIVNDLLRDPSTRARVEQAVSTSKSRRGRSLTPSRWQLVFASIALVLIFTSLVLWRQTYIRNKTGEKQSQQAITRNLAQGASPISDKQAVRESAGRSAATVPAPNTRKEPVIAFLLSPGERGLGRGNKLTLGPGRYLVSLVADVSELSLATYSAVIEGPGQDEVEAFEDLHPTRGPRGSRRLKITVNSSLLPPGDYTLMLYSTNDRSRSNPLEGYSFSVGSTGR